jgi:hypothetical protein
VAIVSAAAVTNVTATAANVSGTRSVLVMLVYVTNPDSVTPASAADQIGNVDNRWFEENSYGTFHVSAASTPWMHISALDCSDLASVLTQAEAAAISNGFDPATFDHEMVYFPQTAACGFAGIAQLGGRITWINGHMNTFATAHELSHNLGLLHAHSITCTDSGGRQVTLSSSCTTTEQGDPLDTMGNSFFVGNVQLEPGGARFIEDSPHLNAAEKAQLGWLAGHIKTVASATSVRLEPYETMGRGVKAIKIDSSNRSYWIEYRQPLGADSFLSEFPGTTDGVLVRTTEPNDSTDLLDARPSTVFGLSGSQDFADAALAAGSSWTTPEGVTITVSSARGTAVRLKIRFR